MSGKQIDWRSPLDESVAKTQSGRIAFRPEEMALCKVCDRANSPARLNCLYCGQELDRPARLPETRTILRNPEPWEPAWNIVLLENAVGIDFHDISLLLAMEPNEIAQIVATNSPMPIARVESKASADSLTSDLAGLGLKCFVIGDAELNVDFQPVRLRSIKFLADGFSFQSFNTEKIAHIAADDLILIVEGIINRGRIESNEKRRRNSPSKVHSEVTMTSDERIVDIYVRGNSTGFRILPAGFDFSGLGKEMSQLAVENLERLVSAISALTPAAQLFDYTAVKRSLSLVWEIESRTDSLGLRQTGYGKREFGSISSTSNLRQFTGYSRLLRHIYEK